jgi:hypothetical protein
MANAPMNVALELLFYGNDAASSIPPGTQTQTAKDYLDLIEKRGTQLAVPWTETQRITNAIAGFRGGASKWWDDTKCMLRATDLTALTTTWATFKKLFRETFHVAHTEDMDLCKAVVAWNTQSPQGAKESVRLYATRISGLAKNYARILDLVCTAYPVKDTIADDVPATFVTLYDGLADNDQRTIAKGGLRFYGDKIQGHFRGGDSKTNRLTILAAAQMCTGLRNAQVKLKANELFEEYAMDFTGYVAKLYDLETKLSASTTHSANGHDNGSSNGNGSGNGKNGKNGKGRNGRNHVNEVSEDTDSTQGAQGNDDYSGDSLNQDTAAFTRSQNSQDSAPINRDGDFQRKGKIVCGFCKKIGHPSVKCYRRLGQTDPRAKQAHSGNGNNGNSRNYSNNLVGNGSPNNAPNKNSNSNKPPTGTGKAFNSPVYSEYDYPDNVCASAGPAVSHNCSGNAPGC